MGATYASTTPIATVDGIPYAKAAVLPAGPTGEADIFNGVQGDPIPIAWEAVITAFVKLTYTGSPSGNTATYVVMQTSYDGGTTWVDVAWFKDTNTSGTNLYVMSGGIIANSSINNTRALGTSPATNGSNAIPLGGVVRFVGQTTLTGGSSPTAVVSLWYKLQGLR
jgi:hypothetical protein